MVLPATIYTKNNIASIYSATNVPCGNLMHPAPNMQPIISTATEYVGLARVFHSWHVVEGKERPEEGPVQNIYLCFLGACSDTAAVRERREFLCKYLFHEMALPHSLQARRQQHLEECLVENVYARQKALMAAATPSTVLSGFNHDATIL